MNYEVHHFDKHACADLPHLIISGPYPEEVRAFWNEHGIGYSICVLIDEDMLNEPATLWDITTITIFEDTADLLAAMLIL
jgi:hypothetical protein